MKNKPRVITNCVANRYTSSRERIIEYAIGEIGGLIKFYFDHENQLWVNLYRHDAQVRIVVGRADERTPIFEDGSHIEYPRDTIIYEPINLVTAAHAFIEALKYREYFNMADTVGEFLFDSGLEADWSTE